MVHQILLNRLHFGGLDAHGGWQSGIIGVPKCSTYLGESFHVPYTNVWFVTKPPWPMDPNLTIWAELAMPVSVSPQKALGQIFSFWTVWTPHRVWFLEKVLECLELFLYVSNPSGPVCPLY